jgi:hypothetical protein
VKRSWGLWVHIGLLCAAASLAWFMSGRTEEATSASTPTTDLWKVDVEKVHSVTFDSTDHHVLVEPHRDKVGSYAVVTVESLEGNHSADAGVSSPPKPLKKRFISVDAAEKMLGGIARFRTQRSIGKLDKQRIAEFGLDKPTGTIKIDLAGAVRTLTIGASTPGGGNYYVRDEQTGIVQVAVGDPISALQYAEARLIERDLHGFKTDEVGRLVVQAGGKRRQLVRVPGKPNAWADVAKPAVADESASNWVTKLAQLRVNAYEEKCQSAPIPVLRVEYGDAKSDLGYIELFRVTEGSDPVKYVVRTERSRWFAEVVKSQAEQLEKDITLVAK